MKFPEKFDLKLLLKLKEFLLDCCYVSLLWLSCVLEPQALAVFGGLSALFGHYMLMK